MYRIKTNETTYESIGADTQEYLKKVRILLF